MLGTYCGIQDLKATMDMNEICNRAGFDTISAGAAIAYAMECYERDLFAGDELDGLRLDWGNGEAATVLMQRMVERRCRGDILFDGVMRAAQKTGRGSALRLCASFFLREGYNPLHTEVAPGRWAIPR